ncbi:MAG TPA: lipopolysaccharide kinase InaA family protein [Planctomycetota bacterium]|nr:lipopolysaccharide kinase InaA family protein [Planctomycetota bacterium]
MMRRVSVRLYLAPDFQTSMTNMSSRGAATLSFDEAWDRWRGDLVDQNRNRDVERVDFGRTVGYLKRFHGIQLKNHLRLRWQQPRCHSQAAREVAIMHALCNAGFHPPRVLAWGQELAGNRELRSLLLTESFDGRPLSDHGPEAVVAHLPDVAEELGRSVAAGLFLPDLGLDHVFVLSNGNYGLLDFHNARRTKRASARELGRALVRFFTSPGSDAIQEHREDFAARYLAAAGRPAAQRATLRLFASRLGPVDAPSSPSIANATRMREDSE